MAVFSPDLPALRSQFDAQAALLDQVAHHAFDTVKQLSELNLRTTRQMVEHGIRLGRALSACTDPLQMGTLAMREIPPAADAWRSWRGSLLNLLAASGATLAHDANDGGWQAARTATGAAAAEDVGAAHNPT